MHYPDERTAWVSKNDVLDTEDALNRQIDEKALVETARMLIGVPYLWGGASPKAVDCSGLTSLVYYMNGIVLPRDASQQTCCGQEITTHYEYKRLRPGDLLFFGRKASDTVSEKVTHVAMYIGNADFIHASGRVRINSMNRTRDNLVPEYPTQFVRAVRVEGAGRDDDIEPIAENDFYREIFSWTE